VDEQSNDQQPDGTEPSEETNVPVGLPGVPGGVPGIPGGPVEPEEPEPPARRRGMRFLERLAVMVVAASLIAVIFHTAWLTTLAAVVLGVTIMRVGWFFLQSFATPLPPPPDPGTLRKVKLVFRCSVCGTEVRMTAATNEEPEPPRHCMDDMELITPIE